MASGVYFGGLPAPGLMVGAPVPVTPTPNANDMLAASSIVATIAKVINRFIESPLNVIAAFSEAYARQAVFSGCMQSRLTAG
jgi:hypothetical protein